MIIALSRFIDLCKLHVMIVSDLKNRFVLIEINIRFDRKYR